MNFAHPRLAASTLALAIALSATSVHAEGVAAGTLIENTASATYSTGGGTQSVDSNTVVVKVDELLDVVLASQDGGAVSVGNGTAILTWELTNTGNGPEAFDLTTDPAVNGNDFDVEIDDIAYDVDGNGEYDPAVDVLLGTGEATPEIAADDALTIFVLVSSPDGVGDEETSRVNLNADATTGTGAPGTTFAGAGENGSDAVVGTTNADADSDGTVIASVVSIALSKAASIADPFGGEEAVPGATVTFTITASVTGSGSVNDLNITDVIPENTTYAASSLALDGTTLTDAEDSDAGNADADGVAVLVGTAEAGNDYSVTFDVTID